MRRPRIAKIWFFGSRNKWARRGRNLAHFLMSFFFYTFAYIFYGIAVAAKWLFSLIFLGVGKVISWKFKNQKFFIDGKKYDAQSYIVLPDRFARLEVLLAQLEKRPIEKNMNVGTIIDLTEGCSEADLIRIVDRSAQIASSRKNNGQKNGISLICEQDLLIGVGEINRTRQK